MESLYKCVLLSGVLFFSEAVQAIKIYPRNAYVALSNARDVFEVNTRFKDGIPINTPVEIFYSSNKGWSAWCIMGERLPGKTSPLDSESADGISTYWRSWNLFTTPFSQGSDGWFRLNDYAEVKLQFGSTGFRVGTWTPGRFGGGDSSCSPQRMEAGKTQTESTFANGKIFLRITKMPVDGVIRLPTTPFLYNYLAYSDEMPVATPSSYVNFFAFADGIIGVPSACTWDSEAPIEMNYGIMGRIKQNIARVSTPFLRCTQDQKVRLSLFSMRGTNTPENLNVDLIGTSGDVVGTGKLYFPGSGREVITTLSAGVPRNFEIESIVDSTEMSAGEFEGVAIISAVLE
ncbi:hypothetical protein ZQ34_003980 [Salmonella enterica subsp. salamae]|nr:hypothetical protein [Salmonella enterica subsp. salamae]EED7441380.1 hypothetical protein [Salmonella enterica subsp. salamae]EEI9684412.1 hypothetical protein [Salmonella enterica]EKN4992895.1 hypothetical protein [Salmonella enterica]EKT4207002.1 hypothetical protein [Salmonella enterica]